MRNSIDGIERNRRAEIVTNQYSGIIPFDEAFYLHSILYSARLSLTAFRTYDELKSEKIEPELLISFVQEGITHAASLSRFFWPAPFKNKEMPHLRRMSLARGRKLSKAFGINKSSALYSREIRNAWEHFDEKLDSYVLELEAGHVFPTPIVAGHGLADASSAHIFKLLDPVEACLVLMNNKYFFNDIRKEVQLIFEKAESMLEQGARL